MAMAMGGNGVRGPELNVTPLIDILLVLLIIFMVIQPSQSQGLKASLPQGPSSNVVAEATPQVDIVITVQADRRVRLNEEPLALEDLASRLNLVNAASRVIFVRADKNQEFQEIAAVIDIARGVGLNRIALMTH